MSVFLLIVSTACFIETSTTEVQYCKVSKLTKEQQKSAITTSTLLCYLTNSSARRFETCAQVSDEVMTHVFLNAIEFRAIITKPDRKMGYLGGIRANDNALSTPMNGMVLPTTRNQIRNGNQERKGWENDLKSVILALKQDGILSKVFGITKSRNAKLFSRVEIPLKFEREIFSQRFNIHSQTLFLEVLGGIYGIDKQNGKPVKMIHTKERVMFEVEREGRYIFYFYLHHQNHVIRIYSISQQTTRVYCTGAGATTHLFAGANGRMNLLYTSGCIVSHNYPQRAKCNRRICTAHIRRKSSYPLDTKAAIFYCHFDSRANKYFLLRYSEDLKKESVFRSNHDGCMSIAVHKLYMLEHDPQKQSVTVYKFGGLKRYKAQTIDFSDQNGMLLKFA